MKTQNTIFSILITTGLLGCLPALEEEPSTDLDSSDDTVDVVDDEENDDEQNDDLEDQQKPPSPEAFARLTIRSRDALTQQFSVDAEEFSTVKAEGGTNVYLWPNSLVDSDGNLVTGLVDVELIEVFDKGSMLVTDVPTNGLNDNGEIAQLVSGGEFYVNASQNGEDLDNDRPYMLTTPADATGGPDSAMSLFKLDGADPETGAAAWVERDPEDNVDQVWVEGGADGDKGDTANTQYGFLTGEFGWSNIDRWYSDPRPKTTIHVEVPNGWDDENCAVYLSYDGENSLARFDTYDDTTGLFSEHYGLIPIGLEVHIIFMTELDGDFSYSIQQTTIVDNHVTVFDDPSAFIETDMDGIIGAINALP